MVQQRSHTDYSWRVFLIGQMPRYVPMTILTLGETGRFIVILYAFQLHSLNTQNIAPSCRKLINRKIYISIFCTSIKLAIKYTTPFPFPGTSALLSQPRCKRFNVIVKTRRAGLSVVPKISAVFYRALTS